jgi:hypothetical protein
VNWMICPKVMWEARDAALAAGLSPGEYIAAAIHHLDRLRTMI